MKSKNKFYFSFQLSRIFYDNIITRIFFRKDSKMAKGTPKRDGSGKGSRANQGRGGCSPTRRTGQGRNPKK